MVSDFAKFCQKYGPSNLQHASDYVFVTVIIVFVVMIRDDDDGVV